MEKPPPQFVEIINTSDQTRTRLDPGLWSRGGKLVLEPGETAFVPLDVWHRICMCPYFQRKERFDELKAEAEAAKEAAAEAEADAEAVPEPETKKRGPGRPRKESEDA